MFVLLLAAQLSARPYDNNNANMFRALRGSYGECRVLCNCNEDFFCLNWRKRGQQPITKKLRASQNIGGSCRIWRNKTKENVCTQNSTAEIEMGFWKTLQIKSKKTEAISYLWQKHGFRVSCTELYCPSKFPLKWNIFQSGTFCLISFWSSEWYSF